MESKKGRPAPRWLVILEDIRSQNRATLEAVEASRTALEGRMDAHEQKTDSRFTVVETAIRSTRKDLSGLAEDIVSLRGDVTGLRGEVTGLRGEVTGLRGDLTALQLRFDQLDQESRSRDMSLEAAIRDLTVSVQQNTSDIRDLAGKVLALSHLEERVWALEHPPAADEASRSPAP